MARRRTEWGHYYAWGYLTGRRIHGSEVAQCEYTLKEEGLGAITYSSSVGIFSCGTPYHTREDTMQVLAKSKAALHFLPQCFYLPVVVYVCANLSLNLNARLERRVHTYRCM